MLQKNRIYFKTIFLGCLSLVILGCGGSATNSSFGSTTDDGTTDGPAGISSGITDGTQFYVGVNSAVNSIAHVHQSGDFSTACSISPTATFQDIKCIVDSPEGEIFNQGLSLVYNIPPGLCHFVARTPYWFYNQEVGRGPRKIVMERNFTDNVLQASTCAISVSDASGSAMTALANCATFPSNEVTLNSTTGSATCAYKSSDANCCFGDYTLTINDHKFDSTTLATSDTTSIQQLDWGGALSTCIGGAGKTNWPTNDTFGRPNTLVSSARLGLTDSYVVTAPIESTSSASNIGISNFYTEATHSHTGFGPVLTPVIPARTSTKPYFIDPIDDRSGSKFPATATDVDDSNFLDTTHDSYEFDCIDQAFEMVHRIRVYVREWDTYQDYVDFISSSGGVEVPDRSGADGVTCAGLIDGGACNDFHDIDDFVTIDLGGGGYTTTLVDVPLRGDYFPKLQPR